MATRGDITALIVLFSVFGLCSCISDSNSWELSNEEHASEEAVSAVSPMFDGNVNEIITSPNPDPTTITNVPETTTTSTSTTTERTTTTPRPPYPYEISSNVLINDTSDSITHLQLQMLRYQTQMSLSTLDNVLPILEGIRQNMSRLLNMTGDTVEDYQRENDLLQHELLTMEQKFQDNRLLQENYTEVQSDTQRQLGVLFNSLRTFLQTQVSLLNPTATPDSVSSKDEEDNFSVEEVEKIMNAFENRQTSWDELVPFLRKLRHPENKRLAYERVLRGPWNAQPFQPAIFQVAYDIENDETLKYLRGELHEGVQKIMSEAGKSIEMRLFNRQLKIEGSTLVTGKYLRERKIWRFTPVEKGRYFLIVEIEQGKAIGVVPADSKVPADTYNKIVPAPLNPTLMQNPRYQWTIESSPSSTYWVFLNRETSLALDANDSSQVYPHTKNGGSNQDWELHL